MSQIICVDPYLVSSSLGLEFASAFHHRVVTETYQISSKDGRVQHTPDPIPVIVARLTWTNNENVDQQCWLEMNRASRAMATGNTNQIRLRDALSWDIGESPNAITPQLGPWGQMSIMTKKTPFSYTKTEFSRYFRQQSGSCDYVNLGVVAAQHTIDLRYECLLDTPGSFRSWEGSVYAAYARWVRLRMWAEHGGL